jgi:hypothetical protein
VAQQRGNEICLLKHLPSPLQQGDPPLVLVDFIKRIISPLPYLSPTFHVNDGVTPMARFNIILRCKKYIQTCFIGCNEG